jgi:Domain of unknown function (DUF4389)
MNDDYPVQYAVDYPDRDLNRLTTFFRLIVAIPIVLLLALVSAGTRGLLFGPVLLMLLFRRKYPRWWFDWNRELMRFSARVGVYIGLMDDRYPSTDEPQAVRLDFEYPDAQTTLNRWLPLVKWFLAIPHLIVLFVLSIAAVVVVILAWFAILFTGRFPRGLFDFLVGFGRWQNRVVAYAFALVTDRYPPFRLRP